MQMDAKDDMHSSPSAAASMEQFGVTEKTGAGESGGSENLDAAQAEHTEQAQGRSAGTMAAASNETTEPFSDTDMSAQATPVEAVQSQPNAEDAGNTAGKSEAQTSAQQQSQESAADVAQDKRSGDPLQRWRDTLQQIQSATTHEDTHNPKKPADAIDSRDATLEYSTQDAAEDNQAFGPASDNERSGPRNMALAEDHISEQIVEPHISEIEGSTSPNLASTAPMEIDITSIQIESIGSSRGSAPAATQKTSKTTENTLASDSVSIDRPDGTRDVAGDGESDIEAEPAPAVLSWLDSNRESLDSAAVWALYSSLTQTLSFRLTEQLRLVMEPTLASRLQGDYRSGKRLNMKRVIAYIVSQYTKDKIWLKRTRPSNREYQVMLSIDDSKSMAHQRTIHLTFQTLALVSSALNRLEVGDVAVTKFGSTVDILHRFQDGPVNEVAGAKLIDHFTFAQQQTDAALLLSKTLEVFSEARSRSRLGGSASELWQLHLIVCDGMDMNDDKIRHLLRKAREQKVFIVCLIVDALGSRDTNANGKSGDQASDNQSVLQLQQVSFTPNAAGVPEMKLIRYIDTFPFEYYVVLRDVEALPDILSQTIRQFFEMVRSLSLTSLSQCSYSLQVAVT